MFASAHLTSGIAVGIALGLRDLPLAIFVLASVSTDWDYAFQILTGRNHRTFVTHSPPVYVAILLPAGFLLGHLLWVALAGVMLHFTLDVWDWGIRMNPFSRRIYGLRLLVGAEKKDFRGYMRQYWTDKRFAGAEMAFAAAAILLVFLRVAS